MAATTHYSSLISSYSSAALSRSRTPSKSSLSKPLLLYTNPRNNRITSLLSTALRNSSSPHDGSLAGHHRTCVALDSLFVICTSVALSFTLFIANLPPGFSFGTSVKPLPLHGLIFETTRDRTVGKTALGFGIHVDNVREASYQRADPNFVMLTPNKEHLAEGIQWKIGKRPVLQSDVNSGNFDGIPRELRPLGKIL